MNFRNRIAVSPIRQYSAADGFAGDWHFARLDARVGLILTEAAAVEARGRISPELGIWRDAHVEPPARTNRFTSAHGTVPGVQLAHAGRKASTYHPCEERQGAVPEADGGWEVVGPTAEAFSKTYPAPQALSEAEVRGIVQAFADAAERALAAGFKVVELHAAHGYLLHSFLSPLSNTRSDRYGGTFEDRARLLLETTEAVRNV